MTDAQPFSVPPIGARVQLVECEHTSNWSRIDVGRFGTVSGYNVEPTRFSIGPRVSVLVKLATIEKWDGGRCGPIHVHPRQLELAEQQP